MNIQEASALDLTDSIGAAQIIGTPADPVSVDLVRYYVKTGRLSCYQFSHGVLTVRHPDELTRGKDLFFLRQDVEALERRPVGYPKGRARNE